MSAIGRSPAGHSGPLTLLIRVLYGFHDRLMWLKPNQRIKSLSGARSRGFIGVRAPGQAGRAYSGELGRTGVNCNPDCNPGRCCDVLLPRIGAVDVQQMVMNLVGIAADDLQCPEDAELGMADLNIRRCRRGA